MIPKTVRIKYEPGTRVELGPWCDRWMRGDRFGEVVKTTMNGKRVHVRMDRSGQVAKLHPSNVLGVIS